MLTMCSASTYAGIVKDGICYQATPQTHVISSVFIQVSGESYTQVAAGLSHWLAIRDGRLYSFGLNTNGRTGLDTTSGSAVVPTQVGSETDWSACSAGSLHSLAIRDGRLYSFGSNANGRTGLNTISGNALVPTQVGSETDWVACSAGNAHSLAIRNGRLYSFGSNANAGTGLNTASGNTLVPTQLGSETDWVACSAGNACSLAIRDGRLYSFGSSSSGQTGQNVSGPGVDILVPTQVGSATDWTICSAGASHSLAIRAGRLYSFGSNASGRTGLNEFSGNTIVPTQVGSETDWVACSAGNAFSLAIRDNKLYTFGFSGVLILSTETSMLVPVEVADLYLLQNINDSGGGGSGLARIRQGNLLGRSF